MLRLEPGLEWADFDMRMDYVGDRTTRTMSDFVTFVRQRSGRQREKFSILSWAAKSKPGPRELLLARLTPHQVKNNTTRGTTPGLIDPLLSDAPANRIALPKRRNQARFSLASWKTWTDASSVNSASHADRKRKAVTSSEKACPEKSSALDFDKDSEQLLGPKQTGRASSALHSIQRSSPSSFFSYSPYASLVSASTPSREPERGRVEVSGLNHIAEAARLKTELEGKYSWTTIRHTNQSKKRKKDDCDDYLDMNHYGGSLGQRPSKSFRIACRSTSRERAQGIVGFSGERDLPLFQASENDPEDYWLHSDARFFDLSRHNLVEDTASRDRITTIPPNESRIIPLSRKVPEPLPFCDHLH